MRLSPCQYNHIEVEYSTEQYVGTTCFRVTVLHKIIKLFLPSDHSYQPYRVNTTQPQRKQNQMNHHKIVLNYVIY